MEYSEADEISGLDGFDRNRESRVHIMHHVAEVSQKMHNANNSEIIPCGNSAFYEY